MAKILSLLFLALCITCQTGIALDLQTAKSQGLVGETPSGYLAPVSASNTEAAKLVKSINQKRKKQYKEIAERNKTSLQAVEQLAGKKALQKTPPGQFILVNGAWKKK